MRDMNKKIIRILEYTFVIFVALYFSWHLGRWHEFRSLGQGVNAYYFEKPMIVDPILNTTKDIYIKGVLKAGTCYEFK